MPILKAFIVSPQSLVWTGVKHLFMTKEIINFNTIFEKYLLYAEAVRQYNELDPEDKKVLEPYIAHLKFEWEQELRTIKVKVHKSTMNDNRRFNNE